MDVVATTPLMMVVMILDDAEILEELMSAVEDEMPFTTEVSVFAADASELPFTKLAVVVAV